MAVYQFPLPQAVGSTFPYARGGRAFPQPVIPIFLLGPRLRHVAKVVIDTGSEGCLFPEWLAWRVGLGRPPGSPVLTIGSSVTLTGVAAWFGAVELELPDPAGVHRPFRWTATVGFTGRGSFGKSSAYGILGVNGGLDQFQRVEFDWAGAGGPEVIIRT